MLTFLDHLLSGVNYGLMPFIIAAKRSLVFGVMDLINQFHCFLYMIGAFATVAVTSWSGSFWVCSAIGAVAAFLSGLVIERVVVRPLHARSQLDQVLATFGLILFFNKPLRWLSSGTPLLIFTPEGFEGAVELREGFFPWRYHLAVTVAALLVAPTLWFVMGRTKAGMLIRASASNPTMVRRIGLDARLVGRLVFAASTTIAGLAGMMNGPWVSVEFGMGEQMLILAFVVAAIGGNVKDTASFRKAMRTGKFHPMHGSFPSTTITFRSRISTLARSLGMPTTRCTTDRWSWSSK